MAMILFNPTDEDFEGQYVGEQVIIKAGAKVKVDDPRGRHIINSLGNRGLVTLEYGDEGGGELAKAKIGIERHRAFIRKQVLDFNQINEGRFQGKLPYLMPTAQLKNYAKKLGIGIREPYNVEDAANEELSKLMAQNKELQAQVAKKDSALETLQNQVTDLTSEFRRFLALASDKAKNEKDAPDGGADPAAVKAVYTKMGKDKFLTWIANNWTEIQTYPQDIQDDIASKHERLYGTAFPERQPIAGEYEIA
jgi:hypothetical protein